MPTNPADSLFLQTALRHGGMDLHLAAFAAANAIGCDLVDRETGRTVKADDIRSAGPLHPEESQTPAATTPRAAEVTPPPAEVSAAAGEIRSSIPAGAEVAPTIPAPARKTKAMAPKRRRHPEESESGSPAI